MCEPILTFTAALISHIPSTQLLQDSLEIKIIPGFDIPVSNDKKSDQKWVERYIN